MKIFKKLFTIGFSIIFVLCIALTLVGCFWKNEDKSARGQIQISFGIDVPKEAKLVYYWDDDAFQDWTKYCVFTFEKEPTDWLIENEFSQKKDESFESSMNEFLQWRTDGRGEDTPQEFIPTFDKEYFWISKGTYFLVYSPHTRMLVAYFVNI